MKRGCLRILKDDDEEPLVFDDPAHPSGTHLAMALALGLAIYVVAVVLGLL